MPLYLEDLTRELDLWGSAGRVARFWWRDDDAVAPTSELTRLLDLADSFDIEVGLAVIPAKATEALVDELASRPHAIVLQHGYRHRNHGRPGAPAVEMGGERPTDEVLDELRAGSERLAQLFGARAESIVAAPWNRIEPPVLAGLAGLGFTGASASGPRAAMQGKNGLVVTNVHVDPMNWRARAFAGNDKALSGVLGELEARRTGASDPDEPLGLLTHHLDHDDALWDFLERFFAATRPHPAARWLGVGEAFAPRPGSAERAAQ